MSEARRAVRERTPWADDGLAQRNYLIAAHAWAGGWPRDRAR